MIQYKPKISVCIPVKDGECWIAPAIASIWEQKGFKDWEIVVYDDGSTDSTVKILKYYKDLLADKFTYHSCTESKGIGYARNYANSIAKGEIICVQDSDDISHKERLSKTWKYFKRHKQIDIVYGSCQYIDAIGKPFTMVNAEPFDWDRLKTHNFIQHPTVAYRADAICETPYRSGCSVLDDWFLYMDFHKAGRQLSLIHI